MNKGCIFELPIGDFSMDGHGECMYFKVRCDRSLEDVRSTHFAIPARTGIDLGNFANEHGDDIIPESVLKRLDELGYKFQTVLYKDEAGTHLVDANYLCNTPEVLADIWVFLLNRVNPNLHCEVIVDEVFPSLLFCGTDNERRFCHSVGYGLF